MSAIKKKKARVTVVPVVLKVKGVPAPDIAPVTQIRLVSYEQ